MKVKDFMRLMNDKIKNNEIYDDDLVYFTYDNIVFVPVSEIQLDEFSTKFDGCKKIVMR